MLASYTPHIDAIECACESVSEFSTLDITRTHNNSQWETFYAVCRSFCHFYVSHFHLVGFFFAPASSLNSFYYYYRRFLSPRSRCTIASHFHLAQPWSVCRLYGRQFFLEEHDKNQFFLFYLFFAVALKIDSYFHVCLACWVAYNVYILPLHKHTHIT